MHAVFVDLSAAYDTVNHKALVLKVAKTIKNNPWVRIIGSLLDKHRFYVEMEGKKSPLEAQEERVAPRLCTISNPPQNLHQPLTTSRGSSMPMISVLQSKQNYSPSSKIERLRDALKFLAEYYAN